MKTTCKYHEIISWMFHGFQTHESNSIAHAQQNSKLQLLFTWKKRMASLVAVSLLSVSACVLSYSHLRTVPKLLMNS